MTRWWRPNIFANKKNTETIGLLRYNAVRNIFVAVQVAEQTFDFLSPTNKI